MHKINAQLANPKQEDPQMTHLQRYRLLSEFKEKTNWTTLRRAKSSNFEIMKRQATLAMDAETDLKETESDAITRTSTRGAGRPRTATTQNALDLKVAGLVRTKDPHVVVLPHLSI